MLSSSKYSVYQSTVFDNMKLERKVLIFDPLVALTIDSIF